MKIAQVSPLYESVPPHGYGGTERVVSYLTEELVKRGHEVTLYASGDSETRARLVPPCARSLRLDPDCVDQLAHHVLMLEMVRRDIEAYDLVHYHIDYLHFPLSRRTRAASLTTLHGRLDLPDLAPLYREFREPPLVSISDAQRGPLPWVNWLATIHHGLPRDLYAFDPGPGDYLAFVGRISPEKRLDVAVEVARAAGIPLRVAGKIDATDRAYFRDEIESLLEDPLVEFVGEIGDREKNDFLGRARGLIFPIDWPEPFGLVMIEAMACGTPTIAFRRGSVEEVIDEGRSGFVVEDLEGAIRAAESLGRISREACRATFERRFTVGRMVSRYEEVYRALIAKRSRTQPARTPARPRTSAPETTGSRPRRRVEGSPDDG